MLKNDADKTKHSSKADKQQNSYNVITVIVVMTGVLVGKIEFGHKNVLKN
jgi:hypothetical protein